MRKGCEPIGKGIGDSNYKPVRSDKKRQVKALITFDTKEMIHRLSHVTHTPLKDVSEYLINYVVNDVHTLQILAQYFKRGVQLDNTFYNGNPSNRGIAKRIKSDTDIISMKFTQRDYDKLAAVAYGLDLTPSRTAAVLLELSSQNVRAINEYVYINLVSELTDTQMNELRKVLSYANRNNKNNSTWITLLSRIVGDIRPASKKLYQLVNEFLNDK